MPDVSADVRSSGRFSAYIDIIEDEIFSPALEPALNASAAGEIAIRLPLGGDALRSSILVPWNATASLVLFAGSITNPSLPGTYRIHARLHSVDPDTGGASDGIAPNPLAFEVALDVDILPAGPQAFDRLDVSRGYVRVRRPGLDWFFLKGTYQLAASSNGIDPLNEDVVVTFGPFSERIAAGKLRRYRNGYVYSGRSGVRSLQLLDNGEFVLATRSLDLTGLTLPASFLFELRVGDDVGSVDLSFDRSGFFRP